MAMGRPPVSVHCGGTPYMPGSSFEERVFSFIGTEPVAKQKISQDGLSGFMYEWEAGGSKVYQYTGIFLDEPISGGMGVAHFATCRAPIGEYGDYANTFEKILKSYRLK